MPISPPTILRHTLAKDRASSSKACPFEVEVPILPREISTSTCSPVVLDEDGDNGGGASAITHADGVLRGIEAISQST